MVNLRGRPQQFIFFSFLEDWFLVQHKLRAVTNVSTVDDANVI